MEMGTDRDNVTPNACVFSEPWSADLSVFKNIDDPQSNLVDIRHHDSVSQNTYEGAVNGILFKTTSGDPLGLDTYCDPSAASAGGATTKDFNLGLGFLAFEG